MYIENDRSRGNQEEWDADKLLDIQITQNVARIFESRGYRVQRSDLINDLKGTDLIINDKKVDIKARRIPFPGDYLIEIIRNNNTGKPGWACDPLHETDIVMYVYPDDTAHCFSYKKIQQLGHKLFAAWNWKYGIVRSKYNIPSYKFIQTRRNNDYGTDFYCASPSELGTRKIISLG